MQSVITQICIGKSELSPLEPIATLFLTSCIHRFHLLGWPWAIIYQNEAILADRIFKSLYYGSNVIQKFGNFKSFKMLVLLKARHLIDVFLQDIYHHPMFLSIRIYKVILLHLWTERVSFRYQTGKPN